MISGVGFCVLLVLGMLIVHVIRSYKKEYKEMLDSESEY